MASLIMFRRGLLGAAARSSSAASSSLLDSLRGGGRGGLPLARALCAAATQQSQRRNALVVLGLEEGATSRQIKMRYYDLAKRTHPDVVNAQHRAAVAAEASNVGPKVASYDDGVLGAADAAAPTAVPFLEVQAAYDVLMAEDEQPGAGSAARRNARRPGQAGAPRARSLGEVLCDRLKDEPEAVAEVWEEIARDQLRVTIPMADAVFRALKAVGRASGSADGMVDAARLGMGIIRDGTGRGLLNLDTRTSAQILLLGWCQQDEAELGDLAFEVIDEITDEDRAHSPAVMSAIGSVFCSGTRSPY